MKRVANNMTHLMNCKHFKMSIFSLFRSDISDICSVDTPHKADSLSLTSIPIKQVALILC